MSRHNRRRTRGGHKAKHIQPHIGDTAYDAAGDQPPLEVTLAFQSQLYTGSRTDYLSYRRTGTTSTLGYPFLSSASLKGSRLGGSAASPTAARHWSNRFAAWQVREAEKRRMFGEADGSGDDEALCDKMMEYFGGLDFIDS